MSAYSLGRRPYAVPRPQTAQRTGDRLDRVGAWVFGLSLAALSAAIVTNAGAVILEFHSSLPITEGLTATLGVQVAARHVRRWRSGMGDLRGRASRGLDRERGPGGCVARRRRRTYRPWPASGGAGRPRASWNQAPRITCDDGNDARRRLVNASRAALLWRPLSHLRAVVVVFGAYVAVTLASTLWAAQPDVALAGVVGTVTDLAIVGVLIVGIRDEHDVRWIMAGLLAGAGVIALLVALQTATGNYDLTFGGFAQTSVAHIAGDTDDLRAVGPYEDPNFFAQMMVSMLPLAIAVVLARVRWPVRVLGALLSATMLVTVITTFSRGALLAVVAVVGAMIYRYRAHRAVLLVAVGVSVVAVLALPAEYTARITALTDVVSAGGAAGAEDPSLQGRTSEMTAAVQMFTDRPLGGVGYDNYPQLYQDYAPWIGLDPRREPREAHSLYLEVASETGVLGVAVLTIGLALARARIVRGRRQLQAVDATHGLLMLDALGLALIAFLMTSVFLHGAYPRVFWLLFGLALIAPWPVRFRRTAPPDRVVAR